MKMNDYVVKADLSEIAHSSGYAKAQNGGRIGTTSSQSFSQRRAIDYRNSRVGSYMDSKLARSRISQKTSMESSLSALDQIRARRAERLESQPQNSNRSKFTTQADKNTQIRMRQNGFSNAGGENSQSSRSSRNFDNISQSGITGLHSSAGASSSSVPAQSFRPDIRPKF